MKINLLEIPVYYINLDKDKEKRDRMESMLEEAGFKNIIRFPGHYIATPKVGCATSHNNLLSYIKDAKMPILVLEDDVVLTDDFTSEIEIPDDSEAVYLGISKYGLYSGSGKHRVSISKYDDNLYRIYNMLGAHAILYLDSNYVTFLERATSFMLSIQDNQDKARANTMKFFNVYAMAKPFFYQDNYHKENTLFNLNTYKHAHGKKHSL